jgi:2-polyprenyl-3-methyl-5-hydroxy-6-metoxy-1,4-benzoquinol methylase
MPGVTWMLITGLHKFTCAMPNKLDVIDYEWLQGPLVPEELLEQCVELYSAHYGRWSVLGPRPGQQIRLSLAQARAWLESTDSNIALAREAGRLIGYAIAVRTEVVGYGIVSWVTQLVVHADYRRANVAKTLLFSMWGFTNHFAWGLVTANPYAVRALEKATRRRSAPARIARNYRELKQVGVEHVPYVDPKTEVDIDDDQSRINTRFYLDHSELPGMISSAVGPGKPWLLGDLDEGWEWFTFTFHDQPQISLRPEEIEVMLRASDQVTHRAYSRMTLSGRHAWAKHTEAEVDNIIRELHITPASTVLDLGCGDGRHALALARRGINVVGVDYVQTRIDQANDVARKEGLRNADFVCADARMLRLDAMFDAAICLYDVVGTYADDSENIRILDTLRRHVHPNGRCLISVMNLAATMAQAKYTFDITKDPDTLLQLPASNTMEETGNIFDPDFFLVDERAGVVYRKEQFHHGGSLPEELIVRDRRYTVRSITKLSEDAGLNVVWIRPVRAGAWNQDHDRQSAKEILLLCEVPTRDAGQSTS